jgi:outer membrane protein insertion porin family
VLSAAPPAEASSPPASVTASASGFVAQAPEPAPADSTAPAPPTDAPADSTAPAPPTDAPADSTAPVPPTDAPPGATGFELPPDTAAVAPPPAAPVEASSVGRISVEGNVAVDSLRIMHSFEVSSGSSYSSEAIRRGIRKLFGLGLFDDVWVERRLRGDVADLVIHVKERPRISKIGFRGNTRKKNADLEKKLFIRVGEAYSPTVVETQIDTLLKLYREDGFAQAAITATADTVAEGIDVAFDIREGEKVKITHVLFRGATHFPENKLKKQLKTKTKGLFGGGDLKDENLAEDREKLEAFYHSHGYRDARVTGHELAPGNSPKHLTLVYNIDEGPAYTMGEVKWSGNQIVPSASLYKLWTPLRVDPYDASRIEKTVTAAYAEYAERGYLYINVDPREMVRGTVVDVEFHLTEGQPSNIRLVNISGNKGTREKVIRREITVHEGDRFRRSALVRTQGDIFRLGLFEDVQVDFTPTDSTDVDINLKVKEKQVGTASAGAGYTSQSGLTGFLELGHNNVLGNGQSLNLHLERGGKRSDYLLSFTEPWFRDTPTLLGTSIFRTSRDLDLYTEKRVGGSGRIGRPLPWPDYSHGSLSYRLEDVTINPLGGPLTPEEEAALKSISSPGRPVRTSSVELTLDRNNQNNPFYPTKGSRMTLNEEFAGGPFGGAVNFNKHRLDARMYFPSILPGVTTMLRGRFGLLSRYADQNLEPPAYERFRLGGGTTPDPLRGYDDYMIVPEKFIERVPITVPDTLSRDPLVIGPRPSGRFQTVRYPGGNYMAVYTVEQQFPVVHPLHAVVFLDAGNTWDLWKEIKPWDLKLGAGIGFRLEIPLLGNVGLDYGYGFNRDDGPHAKAHFLIGNVGF